MDEELYDAEIFTLTDEEGNENEFELLATTEVDGTVYMALEPAAENEASEYVILKIAKDEASGEDILVTIDDDEEFDRIADLFEDEFMTMDYDESAEEPDADNDKK